jgi:hypothetical protein
MLPWELEVAKSEKTLRSPSLGKKPFSSAGNPCGNRQKELAKSKGSPRRILARLRLQYNVDVCGFFAIKYLACPFGVVDVLQIGEAEDRRFRSDGRGAWGQLDIPVIHETCGSGGEACDGSPSSLPKTQSWLPCSMEHGVQGGNISNGSGFSSGPRSLANRKFESNAMKEGVDQVGRLQYVLLKCSSALRPASGVQCRALINWAAVRPRYTGEGEKKTDGAAGRRGAN